MDESTTHELSPEGQTTVEAVDGYLRQAIADGRPIEALIATRRLGEIIDARAKQAARSATEGSWSWTDVGRALGVTRQAAHEKLRARIEDKLDEKHAKLDQAEQAAHAKIKRRAQRGRDTLDRVPLSSPKVQAARERLSEWERREHASIGRGVEKAREKLGRARQSVEDRLQPDLGRVDR